MTRPPPSIKRLWRTGSVYVASFGLNSAFPLLLTPVFTRFLTPSDYGMSAMWQVLLSFTIPIIGLSTHSAVNRRYFHKAGSASQHLNEMRDYITSIIPILIGTICIVSLAYLFAYPLIAEHLLPVSPIWILLVPIAATATFLYNLTISYLNAEMNAKAFALFNNGSLLVTSLISLLLVVGFGWNWQGRVTAGIISIVIIACVSVVYLRHRHLLGGTIRRELTWHAVFFALPLLPHIMANMVRGVSDRLFLSQITDLHEIGLFSVALTLTGIFSILGNAAMQAWIPWLYAHLGEKTVDRRKIVKITYLAFAVIGGAGVLFAAIAPFVFSVLLGPRFEGSVQFVWWLTGAAVLQGFYAFVVPYIAYVERNKYSSYISIVGLGVNLSLNVVFIYFFGVMGVAMTNFLTALYEFAAVFIVANYCMPMPWISIFYRTAPALSNAESQDRNNLG